MSLTLQPLSIEDGEDVYTMLQHIDAVANGFTNPANGLSFDAFRDWLRTADARARQQGISASGEVPEHSYWLCEDGRPVGFGKIRTIMTDEHRAIGGNVGYALADYARGRGLGKAFLGLLLDECRKLGVNDVLLTIRQANQPSLAVALANGGVIEKEDLGRYYVRIQP